MFMYFAVIKSQRKVEVFSFLPPLQLDQVDSLRVIHITGTKGKVTRTHISLFSPTHLTSVHPLPLPLPLAGVSECFL